MGDLEVRKKEIDFLDYLCDFGSLPCSQFSQRAGLQKEESREIMGWLLSEELIRLATGIDNEEWIYPTEEGSQLVMKRHQEFVAKREAMEAASLEERRRRWQAFWKISNVFRWRR